jgi:RAB protein geranylgeranyltransferase component A
MPTGSPYYDRNTPNLKVHEQMQKYGLKSKREVMDFFLEMMPREIIKGDNLAKTLSNTNLNTYTDFDKKNNKSTIASPIPGISSMEDIL